MKGIPPDHPGLVALGSPGATRFLCPFCDWFYDQPPFDPEARPTVAVEHAPGEERRLAIHLYISAVLLERERACEAVLEGHMAEHVEEMTR